MHHINVCNRNLQNMEYILITHTKPFLNSLLLFILNFKKMLQLKNKYCAFGMADREPVLKIDHLSR